MNNNTTGVSNTAVGSAALEFNTTGSQNTAIGTDALNDNTTGGFNTAIGKLASQYNTTGSYNCSFGHDSLGHNRIGVYNVAVGSWAGQDLSGNSNHNTFLGTNADVSSDTSIYNYSTALGSGAAIDTSNQMVFGTSAEKIKIPGKYVGIGGVYNSLSNYALDVSGNGYFSGKLVANDISANRIDVYDLSVNHLITVGTLTTNLSSNFITTTGTITSGGLITSSNGLDVSGNGYFSGKLVANDISANRIDVYDLSVNHLITVGTLTTNLSSNFITTTGTITSGGLITASNGLDVSGNLTTNAITLTALTPSYNENSVVPKSYVDNAVKNTADIASDLSLNTLTITSNTFLATTSGNVGIGITTPFYKLDVSGNLKTTADTNINGITVGKGGGNKSENTAIGYSALFSNTTGNYNTAIGYSALFNNTTGQNNTAIGNSALFKNTSGNENIAIGNSALFNNTTGICNTAIGKNAGSNNTDSYNTFLGAETNTIAFSNYMYSTALGYCAVITASNQMVFGTSSEKIKIPGSYVGIGGAYNPSSGYVLDVVGNTIATGTSTALSFTSTSDYRIKENVKILDNTFTVDHLKPVNYENTQSGKQDIGLIAHELQEIYPFLVIGEKDGEHLQSINYNGIIGILIKEIQDLKKEVQLLRKGVKEK